MKTLLLLLLSGLAHGQCITNIAAAPTATGAQITWTTCTPATSQVKYGQTTSYGGLTAVDNTLVTSHSQAITGLQSNTLYHYIVKSHNATNTYSSQDHTFTTLSGTVSHSVSLSWSDTDPNVTFNVYRALGSGSFSLIVSAIAPLAFTDSAVSNATTYSYYVTAYDGTAESAPSNTVTASVP